MDYLLLKWIHIVSSTVLFGTGIGSAFYLFMANRRGELTAIGFATRHVVIADWLFTTPAVIVQLLTGLAMMRIAGFDFTALWIIGGLGLYLFAGLCWLPVVWLQIRMRDMAIAALQTGQELPPRYWYYDKWWIALGALAFPAVVVVFYLMVFKPVG